MDKTLKYGLIGIGSILVLATGTLLALPKISAAKNKKLQDKALLDEANSISKPVGGSASLPTNPIGEKSDIQKFQDWMDVKHPNWLNNKTSLNKGTGYGNFGSQTNAAWAKYAVEYQKVTPVVAPKKVIKAYALTARTPIYKNVTDFIWDRLAGDSEYIGDLTGAVKKDYSGNPFLELKAGTTLRYAPYNSVKLTP